MADERPTWEEMKLARDGTRHPRIAGHTYEGETCPRCSDRSTYRLPNSPLWHCRSCKHGFIVVSGEAAADIGVPDGTAMEATPVPPPEHGGSDHA